MISQQNAAEEFKGEDITNRTIHDLVKLINRYERKKKIEKLNKLKK